MLNDREHGYCNRHETIGHTTRQSVINDSRVSRSHTHPQRWDERLRWKCATKPPTTPHHKPRQIRSVKGARMVLSLPFPLSSMWFVRKNSQKYQSDDVSILNQLRQAYASWIPLPTLLLLPHTHTVYTHHVIMATITRIHSRAKF